MIVALALCAWASPPDDLRPVLAPADVQGQYAASGAQAGAVAPTLACEALWHAATMCWRRRGGAGRWATTNDLVAWGTSLADLREAAAGVVVDGAWERQEVAGVGVYWVAPAAEGWAATVLLRPADLETVVGGTPVLVATPTQGTLLAWRGGTPALDKVIAVGALKMYDAEDAPVTPAVHRWADGVWSEYARARDVLASPN